MKCESKCIIPRRSTPINKTTKGIMRPYLVVEICGFLQVPDSWRLHPSAEWLDALSLLEKNMDINFVSFNLFTIIFVLVVIQNFISMNHDSLPLRRPQQGSNKDHHTLHMFYHSHTPHWQMIQPYGFRRLVAQGANRIWICLQIGCIFIQNNE